MEDISSAKEERPALREEFRSLCVAFLKGNIDAPQEAYQIDARMGQIYASLWAQGVDVDSIFSFLETTDFLKKGYEKMVAQHAVNNVEVSVTYKTYEETVRYQFNRAHDRVYRYAEQLLIGYQALNADNQFNDLTREQFSILSEALRGVTSFFDQIDTTSLKVELVAAAKEATRQWANDEISPFDDKKDAAQIAQEKRTAGRAAFVPAIEAEIRKCLSLKFSHIQLIKEGVTDSGIKQLADYVILNG